MAADDQTTAVNIKQPVYQFTPLGDYVLLDMAEVHPIKDTIIQMPEGVPNLNVYMGTVLAAGQGRLSGSNVIPIEAKVGDTIFFKDPNMGEVIDYLGKKYLLMKEAFIIARLELIE